MTPEQQAALERLRRLAEVGPGEFIDAHDGWQQREYVHCLQLVANLALAEHADDDEPVTLDWMESVVPEDGRLTVATRDDVGRVYLCEDDVANGIDIKSREQLRALVKGLGQ